MKIKLDKQEIASMRELINDWKSEAKKKDKKKFKKILKKL